MIIVILSLLFISGCGDPYTKLSVPDYSQRMLKLADGCLCEIETTGKIICVCPQPKRDKDIKFVCSQAPSDLYEAVTRCSGLLV